MGSGCIVRTEFPLDYPQRYQRIDEAGTALQRAAEACGGLLPPAEVVEHVAAMAVRAGIGWIQRDHTVKEVEGGMELSVCLLKQRPAMEGFSITAVEPHQFAVKCVSLSKIARGMAFDCQLKQRLLGGKRAVQPILADEYRMPTANGAGDMPLHLTRPFWLIVRNSTPSSASLFSRTAYFNGVYETHPNVVIVTSSTIETFLCQKSISLHDSCNGVLAKAKFVPDRSTATLLGDEGDDLGRQAIRF